MNASGTDLEAAARSHGVAYAQHQPGEALAGCVERLWAVYAPGYPYEREAILPDGGVEIMLTLGPAHGVVDRASGTVAPHDRAWVSGQRRRPVTVEAKAGYDLVGVRLRPAATTTVFDVPARELTDRVIDLGALWGDGAVEELRERLSEARTVEQRFDLLEGALARRVTRSAAPPAFVGAAVAAMSRDTRDTAIGTLADSLGVSHRRLIDGFERHVGLKPKALQRVLRFQRVISMEDRHRSMSWSVVARACGYCDQAHMIGEFRELADMTPGEYRRLRAEYPNYVPEPTAEPARRSAARDVRPLV